MTRPYHPLEPGLYGFMFGLWPFTVWAFLNGNAVLGMLFAALNAAGIVLAVQRRPGGPWRRVREATLIER